MTKSAILILAHKAPQQLARLVSRLQCDYFDIFIHVDSKSDINPFHEAITEHNVIWIEKRINTRLMNFSLIDATMSLIESALSHGIYSYFILLTGQDYPIKSNLYIQTFLERNYPMDFIDMYSVEEAPKKGIKGVNHLGRYYFSQRLRDVLSRLVGVKFFYSNQGKFVRALAFIYDRIMTFLLYQPRKAIAKTLYTYSAGSHFWMLTESSVKLLLDIYNQDNHLKQIFRHVNVPEESYCQTVLSVKENLILPNEYHQILSPENHMDNPAMRLIKWYEDGRPILYHPAIWRKKDIKFIMEAKALFARKFDNAVDDDVMDEIDRCITESHND